MARGGEDCSSASPLRALLPSALFSVSAGELPGVPPAHMELSLNEHMKLCSPIQLGSQNRLSPAGDYCPDPSIHVRGRTSGWHHAPDIMMHPSVSAKTSADSCRQAKTSQHLTDSSSELPTSWCTFPTCIATSSIQHPCCVLLP